jgi:hypothetical protein
MAAWGLPSSLDNETNGVAQDIAIRNCSVGLTAFTAKKVSNFAAQQIRKMAFVSESRLVFSRFDCLPWLAVCRNVHMFVEQVFDAVATQSLPSGVWEQHVRSLDHFVSSAIGAGQSLRLCCPIHIQYAENRHGGNSQVVRVAAPDIPDDRATAIAAKSAASGH